MTPDDLAQAVTLYEYRGRKYVCVEDVPESIGAMSLRQHLREVHAYCCQMREFAVSGPAVPVTDPGAPVMPEIGKKVQQTLARPNKMQCKR
ncbi:hypothetical protein AWV80_33560 [Cupriavidus sp. UYMU48A]|nr:hypothetical protein AWV80_33560 [Cupriavidus sp. UYMU48A]